MFRRATADHLVLAKANVMTTVPAHRLTIVLWTCPQSTASMLANLNNRSASLPESRIL